MNHFIDHFGKDKLTEYLRGEKADPDFFLILDNQISIRFLLKLMGTLSHFGCMDQEGLSKLTAKARMPETHGRLHRVYNQTRDPLRLVGELIHNSRLYEANFNYSIQDESPNTVVVSVVPQDHIHSVDLKQGDLDDLLCRYKKAYFREFAGYGRSNEKIEIAERECLFRGGTRCLYELKMAAA